MQLNIFGGPDVRAKDFFKSAAKAGTSVGAAAMGLGMGDLKSSVALGGTAFGLSSAIDSAITNSRNTLQLDQNEKDYTDEFTELVEACMEADENESVDTVRDRLESMFDDYDRGQVRYDSIDNEEVRRLTREFLENKYSKLSKSYDITGASDGKESARAFTLNKAAPEARRRIEKALRNM